MNLVSLGDCVAPIQKWNPANDDPDSRISYIDIASVSQTEKAITQASNIMAVDAPSRARQIVRIGDVLVSTVRPNLNGVASVPEDLGGATASTGFCVLRSEDKLLDNRYLLHWVRSPEFIELMTSQASGQSYPAVSDKIVKASKIPLPPLDEQRRIAAILDQADVLRRLRRRAIDRLNTLGQSIFYEMFGDIRTNSMGWETSNFGLLAKNEDGRRIPIKMADRKQIEGHIPYYGASGIIDYVKEFLFEGRHLLIGEDGANLLARSSPIAFIADGKFWVNNHAHVLSANGKSDLRFLEFFIQSIDLKKYVTGSAQPKLTQKSLREISTPVPPLVKQFQFSKRIEEIEVSKSNLVRSVTKIDTLFASLQQRAFAGEL